MLYLKIEVYQIELLWNDLFIYSLSEKIKKWRPFMGGRV